MIKAERVKILVTRNGDSIICDVQEAVNKDTNAREAFVMTFPYRIEIDSAEPAPDQLIGDQQVSVRYYPWNPLTTDTRIAVAADYIITIMEPSPSVRDTYIDNMKKLTGDVE
jgi:hypothetical protein